MKDGLQASHPNDEISLSRIINTPRRAISDKTFDLIRSAYSKQDKYSGLLNFILSKPWNENIKLTPRATKGLEDFANIIFQIVSKENVKRSRCEIFNAGSSKNNFNKKYKSQHR